ncbi:MAG: DUF4230 domain-containing protein [Acidimicrobiia bacterium]
MVVVAVIVIGLPLAWKWLGSPFSTKTVDRTAPPVLVELRDLADYRAASGDFEVLVDVEKDVKYLPAFLAGERVFFVGVGSVEASVDFSSMDDTAIDMSEDRSAVVVTLPRATLEDAVVDPDRSHVADRDRGVLDRVGGMFSDNPTGETELYQLAEAKIEDAAAASELRTRAEQNTRTMLVGMLKGMGFERVTVRFVDDPNASPSPATPEQ